MSDLGTGVRLADSELPTVTAAADKVIVIEDDPAWMLDVEFQSSREPAVPRQLLKYNALLQDRHRLPVASVLVVLTRDADSPAYSGRHRVAPPYGPAWEFGYTVVRVWEASSGLLLTGPLALVPLAPVADLGTVPLAEVLQQTVERTNREADPERADRMLTAVGILLQLRYDAVTAKNLLDNIPELRKLELFKLYEEEDRAKGLVGGRAKGLAEGRAEEARLTLLRLGRKKYGPPTPEQEAAVNAITYLARLEALGEKLLDVSSWDELLTNP